MPSINYSDVYSILYGKVKAYDFLDLSDLDRNELMCSWLHSTIAQPFVRKLFSKISLDDEVLTISYEMSYKLDDDSDAEFLKEVFANGMIVEWLNPKINTIENIAQVFGSSDEKFFSQSSHLSQLVSLRDSAKKEQRSLVSDRGYFWNTYLDGTS